MRIGRRAWLKGSLATLGTSGTFASAQRAGLAQELALKPIDLDVRDVRVEGDRALGRRFLLFTPKYVPRGVRLPLLVLLHGLGETIDETIGVRAWVDRYGLGTAFDRLRRPPIARTTKLKILSDERIVAMNADLMRAPFEGFAVVCPFTPKITKPPEFDAYARWLVEVVIPKARTETPILEDARFVAIDGCSLGGYLGIETFIRFPKAFGAWGGVQSAVSEPAAPAYAERLASAVKESGARKAIHIQTSADDVFRKGNERMASELDKRGVPNELLVIPGWHDQPWLREAGAVEMLLWHDRRFRAARH